MLLAEVSDLRDQVFLTLKQQCSFFNSFNCLGIYKRKFSVYSCFNFLMGTLSRTTIQISIACLRLVMLITFFYIFISLCQPISDVDLIL